MGGREVEVTSMKKSLFNVKRKKSAPRPYYAPKDAARKKARLAAVVVVLLVAIFWLLLRTPSSKPISTDKDLTGVAKVSSAGNVAEQYSSDFTRTNKEVSTTGYKSWTKDTVDKAYFTLVYADKTGNFSQVYSTLYMIESAGKNGVKIDDNSYGIDQKGRDEIKARADALVQKAKSGATQ